MNLPDSAPIQPIPGITTLWLYPATKKALPSAMPLSEKAYLELFSGDIRSFRRAFLICPAYCANILF